MYEFDSPPEDVARPKENNVELRGFKPHETLVITATDLASAYEQIGKKTARYARQILERYKDEEDYQNALASAAQSLSRARELAQTGAFTTQDGLNHLARYLQVLDGFATGTGLTPPEVALIQIKDTAGCQTLCVRNTISDEIVAIHTEEDADQFSQYGNPAHGKRWVKIILPDQTVEYCAFGGLCGYGSASGIVKRGGQSMFQASDVIGTTTPGGPIWANAMTFMLMDTGGIESSDELCTQILAALPNQPIFNGGYVIHQIESGNPPKMQSIEFGGDRLVILEPIVSAGRQFQYGVNYPQDPSLQEIDSYTLSEDDEYIREKRIMKRRQRRLGLIANLAGRDQNAPTFWGETPALRFIHRILQRGRGDVLKEWFTGLSNDLVAQNVSVYVSPEGTFHLIVRKGYSQAKRKPPTARDDFTNLVGYHKKQ